MTDISESGLTAASETFFAESFKKTPTEAMRAAIQAYLPFHPPASREEGLRSDLTKILNVDLNVTDEELLRIRNMCERDGDVKIWARMVQKLTDAVRRGREALREQS